MDHASADPWSWTDAWSWTDTHMLETECADARRLRERVAAARLHPADADPNAVVAATTFGDMWTALTDVELQASFDTGESFFTRGHQHIMNRSADDYSNLVPHAARTTGDWAQKQDVVDMLALPLSTARRHAAVHSIA